MILPLFRERERQRQSRNKLKAKKVSKNDSYKEKQSLKVGEK